MHPLRQLFAFPLLACLLTPAAGGAQTATFIDAHVHLNDPELWISMMEDLDVEAAIVLRGRSADHEVVLEAGRRHPDRLFPFASISPEHREYRGSWQADQPSVAQVLDSLLTRGGFFGIGEISVSHLPGAGFPEADFDPSGAVMREIMMTARRHGVPVMIHSEITRLREFEALLTDFPDVPVIWAHGGYTPLVIAQRLLESHPRLTFELSARTWVLHPRSPDYTILMNGRDVWPQWLQLVESMPDRFVVGSDASLRSRESDERKVDSVHDFLRQLTPEAREAVAHRNILSLLGR